MLIDLALAIGGLAVLLGAAWLLVRSAVALALTFGLSRVLVGATIVAFGTSAPEFVVSLIASLRGVSGVAVGNIVGSNVANIALVLGVAALITPMTVHSRLLRWEIPVLAVATAAILLGAANGLVERWEGAVMFAGLVAFIVASPLLFPEAAAEIEAEAEDVGAEPQRGAGLWLQAAWLIVGVAGLAVGAQVAVEGATGVAERVGMSEFAIGVTVIAGGTSLPEVTTTVIAAMRREDDLAIGNIVGSNIFNIFGVIGLTALIAPLDIDRDLFQFEMIALALSTLVLVPLIWPRYRIVRLEGMVLLGLYAGFIAVTLVRGG